MIPLHGWIDDIVALLLSSVIFLGMVPVVRSCGSTCEV